MANPLTFTDIVDAIESITKTSSGGSKATLIGHLVNMVYLDEVMSVEDIRPLFWLLDKTINRRSVAPNVITGISVAASAVITLAAGHGLVTGDIISLYGVSGMTQINGMEGTITAYDATSITVDIASTGFTAWSSGGYVYHRGISLASNTQRILHASWNSYSPPMTQIRPDEQERDTVLHNLDTTSRPTHFAHMQAMNASTGAQTDKLLWTPGADASYLLRYWSVRTVDRLSGSAYPLLPARFHDILISGVVARLTEVKDPRVSIENATLWPSMYMAQLEALRKYNSDWWANIDNQKNVEHFLA